MGVVEWLLVAALIGYCGWGLAKANNRPDRATRAKTKAEQKARREERAAKGEPAPATGPDKPSLLVAAWNASGARPLTASRTATAVAELVGRATGHSWRWGKAARRRQEERAAKANEATRQAAVRLGQVITAAAQRRWEKHQGRTPVVARAGSGPAPASSQKPAPDDSITRTVECENCGARHTLTIQPGETVAGTTCTCGTEHLISRRPLDVPPENESQPGSTTENTKENTMTIPAQRTTPATEATSDESLRALAPADWAAIAQRIATFEPESDADLLNLMTGEVAGICGYAEAYEELHRHCIEKVGLDPRAVEGLGEFAEHVMELTQRMTEAHRMFLAAYQEVMEAVRNGVVLPYNGRFFTGQS